MILSLNSLAEDLNKKYKVSIAAVERQNSKQLEKRRAKAVEEYNRWKTELESVRQQQSILSDRERTLSLQLNQAYQELSHTNMMLQNMALSGAKEVRDRGQADVSYVVDGKEVRIEFDENGHLKKSPYHIRKKKDTQHVEDMPNGEIPNQDLTETRDMIKNTPSNEGMEVAPNYLEHL